MGISSIASAAWRYTQRAAKLYPDFVLGTGNEALTKAMTNTIKNRAASGQNYFQALGSGFKNGILAAEKHNAALRKRHGGFWKSLWKQLTSTPRTIKAGWRLGGRGKSGFGKFWGQTKGVLGALGKRMPLIGTLMIATTEIPNIISAFKDEGLVGGIAEIGKSGLRLGAGALCAGICSALLAPIPVVGPLIGGLGGWMFGDWLMSKVTGKSHSEKKAEAEQIQQNMLNSQGFGPQQGYVSPTYAQINPFKMPQMTMTPQQLMQMQQMLYSGGMGDPMNQDFMEMTSGMNRFNYYA